MQENLLRMCHSDMLALVSKVTRELAGLVASGLSDGIDDKTRDRRVLDLVVLAALGCRGIKPATVAGQAGQSLLTELSSRQPLLVDDTNFASALTRRLIAADWLEAHLETAARAAAIFKSARTSPLLADPLLPGWVYQCLKRKPRRKIIDAAYSGEQIVPALTQWFTPEWIAEFLVEKALAPFTAAGQNESGAARLRFLDPCCGAGHILVPALKQLVRLYMKKHEAPPAVALSYVLEHQLFACDIDPLMIELSGLAIYLSARDMDSDTDLPLPNLYCFAGNKEPGSLWLGVADAPDDILLCGPAGETLLKDSPLRGTFTAIAANPPFLGHRLIPPALARFLRRHYPFARFDLYAAFLAACSRLLGLHGQMAVICQQSFMTITRYRALRQELLATCDITGLIQLGAGVFACLPGEKVNSAIVIAQNKKNAPGSKQPVKCWRILSRQEKAAAESKGIASLEHQEIPRSQFATAGGASFSFWCPPAVAALFSKHPPLQSKQTGIVCVNGLFTCNNNLFVRDHRQINADESRQWVPYDKGGGHKWYKTTPYMLHWAGDGQAIRRYRTRQGQSASLPGEQYYFKQGITYSYIGTKGFRARLLSPGSIFDIASSAIFSEHLSLYYLLGFLNSSLARFLLGVLNPTVNFQIGDLRKLPLAWPGQGTRAAVADAARQAVALAVEIDSFDPFSPAYGGCPLLRYKEDKVDLRDAYRQHCLAIECINGKEEQCQGLIDQHIFELYKIARADRQMILEDPWVARTARPLASVPSLKDCMLDIN